MKAKRKCNSLCHRGSPRVYARYKCTAEEREAGLEQLNENDVFPADEQATLEEQRPM